MREKDVVTCKIPVWLNADNQAALRDSTWSIAISIALVTTGKSPQISLSMQ